MNDRFCAIAQLVITLYFVTLVFGLMAAFLTGVVTIPERFEKTVETVLTLLLGNIALILTYWFQRMRANNTGANT